jgi:hypothetical protein
MPTPEHFEVLQHVITVVYHVAIPILVAITLLLVFGPVLMAWEANKKEN